LTASNFKSQFENFTINPAETKIIYLTNIVGKKEIEEKLVPILKEKGIM
jgi:PTS system ascorbate-specific IIB component